MAGEEGRSGGFVESVVRDLEMVPFICVLDFAASKNRSLLTNGSATAPSTW